MGSGSIGSTRMALFSKRLPYHDGNRTLSGFGNFASRTDDQGASPKRVALVGAAVRRGPGGRRRGVVPIGPDAEAGADRCACIKSDSPPIAGTARLAHDGDYAGGRRDARGGRDAFANARGRAAGRAAAAEYRWTDSCFGGAA